MLGAALLAASAACDTSNRAVSKTSATPSIEIASPTVEATWASFTTGADKQHRTLEDGLQVTDVESGSGTVARSKDMLTVRYILWLSDGRQVDSSDAEGGSFKFTVGTGAVIRGWDEGVPGMAVGGTRRLVIPPALAYGDRGTANQSGVYVIPPNAILFFVIRLVADSPAG